MALRKRFVNQSKIDSGGFGIVYRALRVADNETVALKELSGDGFSERETQRFVREIRIQSKLDHENIVPILASNLTDNPPWFVMPLAKENLRQKLARQEFVGDRQAALHLFFQILDGMEYAHDNGVIHRDLKPENILFFEDNLGGEVAQISDFGLGKRLSNESILITSREWLGTAPYMPPEQLSAFKDVDERGDIFSLGMILYELLTGEVPLHPDFEHVALEGGFSYILAKNSDRTPADRYQSIAELRGAIQEIVSPTFKTAAPEVEFNRLVKAFDDNTISAEGAIHDLDRLFAENENDESFYTRLFPKLTLPILREYCALKKREFLHRLRHFDSFVNGSLPFSFTDTVADLYGRIYKACDNLRARSLVIERLLVMGWSHNRWHVRDALASLLYKPLSEAEILAFRDILIRNPEPTKFLAESVERSKLQQLHKAALKHCETANDH